MNDLTKAREIFGDELRDTHEYVGWINGLSSFEFRKVNLNSCENTWKLLTRVQKFNSQPFKREWIEELFKGEWKIDDQFITCNGDYTGMRYDSQGILRDECNTEITTLNDFLTECKEQGMRVLLND